MVFSAFSGSLLLGTPLEYIAGYESVGWDVASLAVRRILHTFVFS
jgi:hypothetical protein